MYFYRNLRKCVSLARSRWRLSEVSFASAHQPASPERPQRRHGECVGGGTPRLARTQGPQAFRVISIPDFSASWDGWEKKPGQPGGRAESPSRREKNTKSWRDSKTRLSSFPPKACPHRIL